MANYEIERKFLLKQLPEVKYDEIIYIKQYYLESGDGYSDRVRKIEGRGGVIYQRTKKIRKFERANEEIENEISENKFNKLKKKAISKIEKYRHIINNGEFRWEIDNFKNINLIIGEIEIVVNDKEANQAISKINNFPLPDFITDKLIMEVSDFKPFSNKRLAVPIIG
jgi:CYTH domain-containing protein